MKMKKCSFKTGISTFEFLIVVCMLFVAFITLSDISLYLKQPYLVQTFGDEILVELQNAHDCQNQSVTSEIVRNKIRQHFNRDVNIVVDNPNNFDIFVFHDPDTIYAVTVKCRDEYMPETVMAQVEYNGVFMYKHKKIVSEPTASTSSYY